MRARIRRERPEIDQKFGHGSRNRVRSDFARTHLSITFRVLASPLLECRLSSVKLVSLRGVACARARAHALVSRGAHYAHAPHPRYCPARPPLARAQVSGNVSAPTPQEPTMKAETESALAGSARAGCGRCAGRERMATSGIPWGRDAGRSG
jgi:hypothetical protein